MAIEREIRFAVDPGNVETLLTSPRVRRAARGDLSENLLQTTYFDTRRHALRRAGAALRIRRANGGTEQTLKMPAAGPAGMQNCMEWTVPAAGTGLPDLQLFDDEVLRRFPHRGSRMHLEPIFLCEVTRSSLLLKRGSSRFEMAVDVGRLQGCSGSQPVLPVCEVEFELQKGAVADLLDFLIDLVDHAELLPLYPSKAQRGYVLARPRLRLRESRAAPVALATDLRVGDAFQEVAGESLRHLNLNTAPVLEGSPGGVHQSRVAIRRIRAALRAFKAALPYEGRKAFNGEFRWFQDKLAPARDWHVFLSETLPKIATHPSADGSSVVRLRALAQRERRRATADAVEALSSRRYLRLLLRFQRWLLDHDAEQDRALRKPLKPFAARVLTVTVGNLLADRRPLARMSEEDRHTLRKEGKKARYAMEFFAGLWRGPEVDAHIAALEEFQDRLGEANDAVVARHLLAGVSPRQLAPELLLVVQRWSQAQEATCTAAGQSVWRRVQKAPDFWT